MKVKKPVLILGTSAVALGFAMLFIPSLARGASTDGLLVILAGIVALSLGVQISFSRLGSEIRFSETPEPEKRAVSIPGNELDSLIERFSSKVRERLEEAAVKTLMVRRNLSEEEAKKQLEDGEWTQNTHAASFFSATEETDTRTGVLGVLSLGMLGRTESEMVLDQARAVVDELADISGLNFAEEYENEPENGHTFPQSPLLDLDEEDLRYVPEPGEEVERKTNRWKGVGALSFIAVGTGILLTVPSLLLVGALGALIVTYASTLRYSNPSIDTEELEIERGLSDTEPVEGDEVVVEVTLRNTGDRTHPDIRFIDGVPSDLLVTGGSPRCSVSLRPGKEISFRYRVEAKKGTHEFIPPLVVSKDITCGKEVVQRLSSESSPTSPIVCREIRGEAEEYSPRPQTTPYVGRMTADVGGAGVEFYTTRDYQPGDSLSLINWKRLASTGELSTIEFQEEREAKIMIAIDTRNESYVSPDRETRSSVGRSIEAAETVLNALGGGSNQVGLTLMAPEPHSEWLAPGGGKEHLTEAKRILDTEVPTTPPNEPFFESVYIKRLRRRLSSNTQLVIFSPLCDDYITELSTLFNAIGHRVTIVSPDPFPDELDEPSLGKMVARIERDARISQLRQNNIVVYNWPSDEPIELTFERLSKVNGGSNKTWDGAGDSTDTSNKEVQTDGGGN